jgi:hypothetical protein
MYTSQYLKDSVEGPDVTRGISIKKSKATAALPASILGNHGGKRAITIQTTKDDQPIGEFSISKAGIQFCPPGGKAKKKSWKTIAGYFS